MRNPVVAGAFYPEDPETLKKQIKDSFLSEFGPKNLPIKNQTKDIIAVITPHAGFAYSGPCAAFAYKEIAESKRPDLFIILGVSHSGQESCVSLELWKTPLGIVEVDTEFGKRLMKNSGLRQDETAHKNEHSIEVQLPFLQFIVDKPKILPILVSEKDYKSIAVALKKTIEQMNKKVIIIASSDFTHYGTNYGYTPFKGTEIKKQMYDLDKKAINEIINLNTYNFINYINKTKATICGKSPILALMETIKPSNAELLKYYTSADIIGNYSMAVGYASIIFKKK